MELEKDLSHTKTILENYPREQRYLLAIMQDIQRQYHYLPRKTLYMVKDYLDIPLSKLYSMATFYRALTLKPKGKYIIKVCDGTACHIKSSQSVLEEIRNILEITPGSTTKDGAFSLETVNCMGSCAVAPVMVIDGRFYGRVTPSMVKDILLEYTFDMRGA